MAPRLTHTLHCGNILYCCLYGHSSPTNLIFLPLVGKTLNRWVFSSTDLRPSNQAMGHNQLFSTYWILATVGGASLLELDTRVGTHSHCENSQRRQIPMCCISHGASTTSFGLSRGTDYNLGCKRSHEWLRIISLSLGDPKRLWSICKKVGEGSAYNVDFCLLLLRFQ